MKQTRNSTRRAMRSLIPMAACAAALGLAAVATASDGPNYGHFNPLTGKPDSAPAQVGLKYGDFNPLSGRPNSAPQAPTTGATGIRVGTTPEPAAPTIQTVVRDHGDQSLALSLAGAALLVAVAGTGYTMIRMTRVPRPARTR